MVVLALIMAVAYGYGLRRMHRASRDWPRGRTGAFVVGVVCVAAAGAVGDSTFTRHMAGHVLVAMAAPVGLALGAPLTLALQSSGRLRRRRLLGALHSRPAQFLAHPVAGWILFGGGLVGFYLSPLFPLSLRHESLHAAVHLHFLLVGCVFVWPLVGVDPLPRRLPHGGRMLAVLVAVPFHAALGLAITSTSHLLAPDAYPSLSDQRSAGAIGWAAGEVLAVVLVALVFRQWVAADRREARRFDRKVVPSGGG